MSQIEGYRYDEPGNPTPMFPKTVNSRNTDVPNVGTVVQYERPDFIEDVYPAIDEILRMCHYTAAPNEAATLRAYCVVISPDGYIGMKAMA